VLVGATPLGYARQHGLADVHVVLKQDFTLGRVLSVPASGVLDQRFRPGDGQRQGSEPRDHLRPFGVDALFPK